MRPAAPGRCAAPRSAAAHWWGHQPWSSRPLRPRHNGPDLGLVHVNMLTSWQGRGAEPSHLALAYKRALAGAYRAGQKSRKDNHHD
jgi:hypothetical protein